MKKHAIYGLAGLFLAAAATQVGAADVPAEIAAACEAEPSGTACAAEDMISEMSGYMWDAERTEILSAAPQDLSEIWNLNYLSRLAAAHVELDWLYKVNLSKPLGENECYTVYGMNAYFGIMRINKEKAGQGVPAVGNTVFGNNYYATGYDFAGSPEGQALLNSDIAVPDALPVPYVGCFSEAEETYDIASAMTDELVKTQADRYVNIVATIRSLLLQPQ